MEKMAHKFISFLMIVFLGSGILGFEWSESL